MRTNGKEGPIRRGLLAAVGLTLALGLLAGPRLLGRSGAPPRPAAPEPVLTPTGGDALAPIEGQPYVFERAKRPAWVQPSSLKLVAGVRRHPRLLVQAVPSTDRTAAIFLQEQSDQPTWGGLFIPAERGVFTAFAEDPAMGEWLIVMVDVFVTGARDPVPLTAYRWHRVSVEAYARCGIPAREVEGCTKTFFASARTVFFAPHVRLRRGI